MVDQVRRYLRHIEWSLGNAQCPECHGRGPSWLGFAGWGNLIGHKRDCDLASALAAIDQPVVYETEYDRITGKPDLGSAKTQALLAQIEKAYPELDLDRPVTEHARVRASNISRLMAARSMVEELIPQKLDEEAIQGEVLNLLAQWHSRLTSLTVSGAAASRSIRSR